MRIERAVLWLLLAAGLCAAAVWMSTCGDDAPPAQPVASGAESDPAPEQHGGENLDHLGEDRVEMAGSHPIRGTVRMAHHTTIHRINPILSQGQVVKLIDRFINLKLLEIHPEAVEPIPWLAASLPDLSADALVQDWTLREGARWTDGKPVTSADVVFSWKALENEKMQKQPGVKPLLSTIGPVASVEATGERTFRVTMRKPTFLSWAAFGMEFPILQHPDRGGLLATATQHRMDGTGPYTVAEFTPQQLVLERKLEWWGDAHETFENRYRVKRFIIKRVEESATRLQMLRNGDIDITGVTPEEYVRLEGKKGIRRAHYFLSQWSYIGWNCEDPVVGDVRVRTALSHLVQRKRIIEKDFHGLSFAVTGPFFTGSAYYDRDLEPHRFSVTTAKKLLEAAGWKDHDGDGDLDKDGTDLSLTIKIGTALAEWFAGPLKQYEETLAQVGIACTIERQDLGAVFGAARKGEFQAYVAVWPVHPLLSDMYDAYHSSQIDGGNNWQRYRNGEMDAALETFRMTLDDTERIRAAHTIHRLLHADQPMMFLFNVAACVAWRERLEGVHVHPLGFREWDFWVEDD